MKKPKKILGKAQAVDLKVLFDTYFKKPEKLTKRDNRNQYPEGTSRT